MKREGDGASPIGVFKLEQLYYRPDRISRPRTQINSRQVKKSDGWCDASGVFQYNRQVNLPFAASQRAPFAHGIQAGSGSRAREDEIPGCRGKGNAGETQRAQEIADCQGT